jgi:hypothetical protein
MILKDINMFHLHNQNINKQDALADTKKKRNLFSSSTNFKGNLHYIK